jgi:salicylate 5-hydroxylase small subunit
MTQEHLLLGAAVNDLNARYAAHLDARNYDEWLALFASESEYYLQSRENYDQGLPLATMRFESKGMMRDRVYGLQNTLFHAPYFQRHVFGPAWVKGHENGRIQAQSNYVVIRTKEHEAVGEVFSTGVCIDVLVQEDGVWCIASRRIVFDTGLILNSIIYPL